MLQRMTTAIALASDAARKAFVSSCELSMASNSKWLGLNELSGSGIEAPTGYFLVSA
jgi:hypothetical protein